MVELRINRKKRVIGANCGNTWSVAKFNDNETLSNIRGNEQLLKAALVVMQDKNDDRLELEYDELCRQSHGLLR